MVTWEFLGETENKEALEDLHPEVGWKCLHNTAPAFLSVARSQQSLLYNDSSIQSCCFLPRA